jgi:hypothetical protein
VPTVGGVLMQGSDLDRRSGDHRAAAVAAAITDAPKAAAAGGSTLVFVDAARRDKAPDLPGLATVVLAGDRDGLGQIADHLAGQPRVDLATILVLASGEPGKVFLGNGELSSATLGQYAKALAEIGAAVQPGGRLLFDVPGFAAASQDGRDLLTRIAVAAGIRVGAPVGAAPADGQGPSADPEIWAAVPPGNLLVHAIDSGTGIATQTGSASFDASLGLLHVGDIALAPAEETFFVVENNGGGDEEILSGSLPQALNGDVTTLTTLFSDTNTLDNLTGVLGLDVANQQIYFVDGQLNATGVATQSFFERMSFTGGAATTLAAFNGADGGGIPGMALDLGNGRAYFAWEEGGSTSNGAVVAAGSDRLYVATGLSGPGVSSVTLSQLPLTGFPNASTFIESLAIDPVTQVLYFTTGTPGGVDAGGIYAYTLDGSNPTLSSGSFTTVFSQTGLAQTATSPWGNLQWLLVDPISGEYYVSVAQFSAGTNESGIFVGSLNGGTPTLFLSTTAGISAPAGLTLDYPPSIAGSHPGATFVPQGPAVIVDSAFALSDPATSLYPATVWFPSATVTIENFVSGDTLTAEPSAEITESFYQGILTLTGVDTMTDYQQVLDSIAFSTTNSDTTTRTLDFIITDGAQTASVTETVTIACYCRGTRILTDNGEVAIEELAIGDRVVTHGGGSRPIKWIGRRAYDGRLIAGNRQVLPIVVAAGALADGVPHRDLRLSPHHALFLDGVLIPVEHLINGASIVQPEAVEAIEYFHVELDGHDVIFAEGAAAETFVDCDSRGMFHNAGEFAELYPGEVAPRWQFYAPRLGDEPQVEALWRRLALGAGITVEAGPLQGHLDEADCRVVRGWARDAGLSDMPVLVEVVIDGVLFGSTLANRYRADLAAAGYGHGRHGFEFVLPTPLTSDRPHMVVARRAADRATLTGAPRLLPSIRTEARGAA